MRKWLVCLTIATLFVGCKSDEQGVQVTDGQLSFTWNADVCEQEIRLTNSGSWQVSSDANCRNWCYPVRSSGDEATITLWVSPNITDKPRSGKVTVISGGKSQEISVSQPAFTGNLDDYVYHLPVVFHVMYNDASNDTLNVKESQLKKILEGVNKLYAANKMNIVFEMAKYDKEGKKLKEPGIIRHEVKFKEYDPGKFLDHTNEEFSDYQLNLKKNINIYVFRFKQSSKESTTMGITTLPVVSKAHPLDSLLATDAANDYAYLNQSWGVCINNAGIYEWQDNKSYNPRYVVATMAHELGHYLGLLHTFSNDECNNDDACDDTHISDYDNYMAYVAKLLDDIIASGRKEISMKEVATRIDCKTNEEFLADNILDYTYTTNEKFTAQQRARTRHILKYAPLVPGPKLVDYNTTGKTMRAVSTSLDIKKITPCPEVPFRQLPVVGAK